MSLEQAQQYAKLVTISPLRSRCRTRRRRSREQSARTVGKINEIDNEKDKGWRRWWETAGTTGLEGVVRPQLIITDAYQPVNSDTPLPARVLPACLTPARPSALLCVRGTWDPPGFFNPRTYPPPVFDYFKCVRQDRHSCGDFNFTICGFRKVTSLNFILER